MARLTKQQIADNTATQLKAEQQAELKRLRAEKRKLRNMITPAPEAKTFDPAAEDAQRQAKINAAWDTLMDGFEVPSWKRAVTGLVIGLLAAFGTGYIVGTLAGMLLGAAVAVTGMAWIGYVIFVLGIVAGGWAGGRVGTAVYSFIADKKIDAVYEGTKRRVTGWFKKPTVVQFSGAHAA